MYSNFALEQEQSTSRFWGMWKKVKGFIPNLIALPGNISILRKEALFIIKKAKNPKYIKEAKKVSERLSTMHTAAINIKAKIDKYLSQWQSQEKTAIKGLSGKQLTGISSIGLVPLVILGAVGIAALSYVSVKGLSLVKQYAREKSILDDLKAKTLTFSEAQALIKETGAVEAGKTFIDTITEKFTSPLAMPIMAAGFVGVFMLWKKMK